MTLHLQKCRLVIKLLGKFKSLVILLNILYSYKNKRYGSAAIKDSFDTYQTVQHLLYNSLYSSLS